MPIYEYECRSCSKKFERIEKVSTASLKESSSIPVECEVCHENNAFRIVSKFKIGSGVLETTGKSGYQTDDLTLGKIIDDGGVPYEFKGKLREREKKIKRVKEYTKGLKERGKRYGFDPFSAD